MKHLRRDYDNIQPGPGGKQIPEDEPVFLIRGQDPVGAAVVLEWAHQAHLIGADPTLVDRVREWSSVMENWATTHGKTIPDVPDGMLR